MIQDIYPHRFDNSFHLIEPKENDIILYYEDNTVLVDYREDGQIYLPSYADYQTELNGSAHYLFAIDNTNYFLADKALSPIGNYSMQEVQIIRQATSPCSAFASISGWQLYRWERDKQYCGRCGNKLQRSAKERALYCDHCGLIEYPKICPDIIVAVANGDQLLMAQSALHKTGRYALIAGFVEIGETFEEAVAREVWEEAGVHVKNIRYYKSQPWSFSDTVMIGFTADLDGDDTITVDHNELLDARWFPREEIPRPASNISISGVLINNFIDKVGYQ